jgi:hypothetical protein
VRRSRHLDSDEPAEEKDSGKLKPDWKDFIALTLAAYQILLLPVLLVIGAIVVVVALLRLLA